MANLKRRTEQRRRKEPTSDFDYMTPKLEQYVGRTVTMHCNILKTNKFINVVVRAVENAGVWVELPGITAKFVKETQRQAELRTIVHFLPFARIDWIMGVAEPHSP